MAKVSMKTLVKTSDLLAVCAAAVTVGVQEVDENSGGGFSIEDFGGNFAKSFGKIFAKN